MAYSVAELAGIAGITVRTLHYYDQIGLLRPSRRGPNGYREYGDEAIIPLQQILFFRELGFSLNDIRAIVSSSDFDVLEALESHRALLLRKSERLSELLRTLDSTIRTLKEGAEMKSKEYYKGFNDDKVEEYREEVRRRWGEKVLKESDERLEKMNKSKFIGLQDAGGKIFQAIGDNMERGVDCPEVQRLIADWRAWLEHFAPYSDEAVLGLGRFYSEHPDFIAFFERYRKGLAAFMTRAIECYCAGKGVK